MGTVTKQLTPEQYQALAAFSFNYGRGWRKKLSDKWLIGADAREPNGHLLRQVRNQFGPSWLEKFDLTKDYVAPDQEEREIEADA